MILPSVPAFSAGAPSIANLNALSYAVSFLADCDVRPTFHLYKTAGQSIPSGVWTSCNMGGVAYDNDGMYNGTDGSVIVVTQGYYVLEGSVQLACTTSQVGYSPAFLMTGGASNPYLAPGATYRFGFHQDTTPNATASADSALCCTDITPYPCYPGDAIHLQIYTGNAMTLDNNTASSYEKGRFVVNFTGQWLRTGT